MKLYRWPAAYRSTPDRRQSVATDDRIRHYARKFYRLSRKDGFDPIRARVTTLFVLAIDWRD